MKVKLTDEFDKNYEPKAFFDEKYKQPKLPNRRGAIMMCNGKLKFSVRF